MMQQGSKILRKYRTMETIRTRHFLSNNLIKYLSTLQITVVNRYNNTEKKELK